MQSGDRILAVNGKECGDAPHERVLALIAASRSPLQLRVMRCPATAARAKRVTESLIGERNHVVMNTNCYDTDVPHLTVEMLDEPLGRTKMLQHKCVATLTSLHRTIA